MQRLNPGSSFHHKLWRTHRSHCNSACYSHTARPPSTDTSFKNSSVQSTLSLNKVPTFKLSVTLSNLSQFLKIVLLLESLWNLLHRCLTSPTTPYRCCCTTLGGRGFTSRSWHWLVIDFWDRLPSLAGKLSWECNHHLGQLSLASLQGR